MYSTALDHTSILKLIEQKWNLGPLTRRGAAAASPLEALGLDAGPGGRRGTGAAGAAATVRSA